MSQSPKIKLRQLMEEYPTARIVTDVGASMLSGWGDLTDVEYHEAIHVIELKFS